MAKLSTPTKWGLSFAAVHFLIIGWFALHFESEHAGETLTFVSMVLDLPIMYGLELLRSGSLINNNLYSGSPLLLYLVLLIFGSAFYFGVGFLLGWIYAKLTGRKRDANPVSQESHR